MNHHIAENAIAVLFNSSVTDKKFSSFEELSTTLLQN
jgi:hypothetical protein